MTDTDKRHIGRRNRRVSGPQLHSRSDAEKTCRSAAQERSIAAGKAEQTRVRRITMLKTLKTGEEGYSQAE